MTPSQIAAMEAKCQRADWERQVLSSEQKADHKTDHEPRCDCGWLFEICDYPTCPCARVTDDPITGTAST